jgi:hypothetical protein
MPPGGWTKHYDAMGDCEKAFSVGEAGLGNAANSHRGSRPDKAELQSAGASATAVTLMGPVWLDALTPFHYSRAFLLPRLNITIAI